MTACVPIVISEVQLASFGRNHTGRPLVAAYESNTRMGSSRPIDQSDPRPEGSYPHPATGKAVCLPAEVPDLIHGTGHEIERRPARRIFDPELIRQNHDRSISLSCDRVGHDLFAELAT